MYQKRNERMFDGDNTVWLLGVFIDDDTRKKMGVSDNTYASTICEGTRTTHHKLATIIGSYVRCSYSDTIGVLTSPH